MVDLEKEVVREGVLVVWVGGLDPLGKVKVVVRVGFEGAIEVVGVGAAAVVVGEVALCKRIEEQAAL